MAIKTERGGKLYIKPSLEYSDDFETYESLSVESSSDDDGPLSQVQLAVVFCCSWQCHLKCDCAQASTSAGTPKPVWSGVFMREFCFDEMSQKEGKKKEK